MNTELKEKIEKILINPSTNEFSNKRMTDIYFKKNFYDVYNEIMQSFDDRITFRAKLYLILKNINEIPKCKTCGKITNFQKFCDGFGTYCCNKCIGNDPEMKLRKENTSLKNHGVKYSMQSKEIQERKKATNLKKYGCEFAQQNEIVKEKCKQTNLERYGVEYSSQNKEIRKKIEETNVERYGFKSAQQNKEVQEKTKQTNLKKYGVEYLLKNTEIRNKIKLTNLERYGVDHYSKTDEYKEKCKQTNLERYGVEYTHQNPEIMKKVKETFLNIYGVDNPMKIEAVKEKGKQTNLERYGVENIFQSEEIKEKIFNTNIIKYGSKSYNQTKKSKENIKQINVIKYKDYWSNILQIDVNNLTIDNDNVTIRNLCPNHETFSIFKGQLYNRKLVYKLDNICTICNPIKENISLKEIKIKEFLDELNINYINNDRSVLKGKELDIYILEKNLAIEFNGLFWHSSKFIEDNFHLNKTIICENNNIKLLHIFEDEWIYKQNIVKSIIKSNLNIYDNIIELIDDYDISEIDNDICLEFLNNNDIEGYIESDIKLGLFYNNELISIMCYNKLDDNNKYELLRYCNKLNTNIVNGFSIMIDYFKINYQPISIIASIDRRYYNKSDYEKLGFEFVKYSEPDYCYLNKKNCTRNRNILNEEYENKIYDCGNIKFKLNI